MPKRTLKLELIDDKAPISATGVVDRSLFTGGNKLYAVMDDEGTLWSLRYDSGNIPEPLRQRFTTFTKAFKAAEDYFSTRNIRIKEDR